MDTVPEPVVDAPVVDAPVVADPAPTPDPEPAPMPEVEAKPSVSVAPSDPTEFVDPVYQCDHPVLGRAGTLRIWRWENDFGTVATRNFTTGQLSLQHVKFTGVEVTSYEHDGDEIVLGKEEDITKHVLDRKAL